MNKFLIAALASAALVGAADAATFTTDTYTVSFANQATDISGLTGTFNLFDSSLGTLTAINISDSYGFSTTITVTNTGNKGSTGTATTSSLLGVAASDSAQNSVLQRLFNGQSTTYYADSDDTFSNPLTFNYDSSATSNPQSYTLAKGASSTLTPNGTASVSSGVKVSTLAGDLAAFTASAGNTTGTITFSTLTSTNLSNTGGNTDSTQTTNANGAFSIFYTYESAVPEPATWAMMIGGFGLVGYGMRRRGVAVAFN